MGDESDLFEEKASIEIVEVYPVSEHCILPNFTVYVYVYMYAKMYEYTHKGKGVHVQTIKLNLPLNSSTNHYIVFLFLGHPRQCEFLFQM